MSNESSTVIHVRIAKSADRSLDSLAKRLGKTKASVVRDAVESYENEQRLEALIERKMLEIRKDIEASNKKTDAILEILNDVQQEEQK
jgi:predicted DNA-binding protein